MADYISGRADRGRAFADGSFRTVQCNSVEPENGEGPAGFPAGPSVSRVPGVDYFAPGTAEATFEENWATCDSNGL